MAGVCRYSIELRFMEMDGYGEDKEGRGERGEIFEIAEAGSGGEICRQSEGRRVLWDFGMTRRWNN